MGLLRKSNGELFNDLVERTNPFYEVVLIPTGNASGATGNNIDYDAIGQETGGKVMCTLFDSIAKENEAKGIVETGIEFKIPENDIIKRLQNKLNISLQMAQEYFQMFGKQTV